MLVYNHKELNKMKTKEEIEKYKSELDATINKIRESKDNKECYELCKHVAGIVMYLQFNHVEI